MKERFQFFFDQKKGIVQAKFYELKEEGKEKPPRLTVCKIEDALHKETQRGIRKRSKKEVTAYIIKHYNEILARKLKEKEKEEISGENKLKLHDCLQEYIKYSQELFYHPLSLFGWV